MPLYTVVNKQVLHIIHTQVEADSPEEAAAKIDLEWPEPDEEPVESTELHAVYLYDTDQPCPFDWDRYDDELEKLED